MTTREKAPRGRRRPIKPRVLALAQAQLRAGGYNALSFGQIADDVGATRAALHHHYSSKHGLATAATEAYVVDTIAAVEALAAQHRADLPAYLAKVEALLLSAIENDAVTSRCVCSQLLREQAADTDLLATARDFQARKLEIMEGVARASQEAGMISSEIDAATLAARATALILGIGQMAESADDPRAFARRMAGTLSEWIEHHRA